MQYLNFSNRSIRWLIIILVTAGVMHLFTQKNVQPDMILQTLRVMICPPEKALCEYNENGLQITLNKVIDGSWSIHLVCSEQFSHEIERADWRVMQNNQLQPLQEIQFTRVNSAEGDGSRVWKLTLSAENFDTDLETAFDTEFNVDFETGRLTKKILQNRPALRGFIWLANATHIFEIAVKR